MSNGLEAKQQRLLRKAPKGREEEERERELFNFPINQKAKSLEKMCVYMYELYIYRMFKYEIGPKTGVSLPRMMHSFA